MIIVRRAIMSVRNIIMTLHNWIRILAVTMVVLGPVRTGIVHVADLFLVGLLVTDAWSVLGPMTTI